ncbi:hypothetical protein PMI08_02997 [Brevibacillus sp. CF112]|nr:hypothetical protein PMI08_02997 [Brevibacillus sp. CF112]
MSCMASTVSKNKAMVFSNGKDLTHKQVEVRTRQTNSRGGRHHA